MNLISVELGHLGVRKAINKGGVMDGIRGLWCRNIEHVDNACKVMRHVCMKVHWADMCNVVETNIIYDTM